MSYLVDTHVLLWAATNDSRLSRPAISVLLDKGEAIHVSAVSGYEIANKFRIGKLPEASVLLSDFNRWVRELGFVLLPLTTAHAVRAGLFAGENRDPFDRLLAAQAEREALTLLSNDDKLDEFGVRRVW